MSETDRPRSFAEAVTGAPTVTARLATAVALERYGLTGTIQALGSQTDANFVLRGPEGAFLLKFANPATRLDELLAQSEAAHVLGTAEAGIATPLTRPGLDGQLVQSVAAGADGQVLSVRALGFVEGDTLSGGRYLAPVVVRTLGEFAAHSVHALAGFAHPGSHRVLEWDVRNADRVVTDLLPSVADDELAARVGSAMTQSWSVLERLDAELPRQVVHGDITDDNVVARPNGAGQLVPFGIIDFGDVMYTWRIAELAVTCSSILHHDGASPASVLPAVRAFHALVPLETVEVEALWPLVVARAATLVVGAHHAARVDPDNEYAAGNADHEHRIFEVASSVPPAVMTALIRADLGLAGEGSPEASVLDSPASDSLATDSFPARALPLLPGLEVAGVVQLDLSSTSTALGRGRFAEPGVEEAIAADALASGAAATLTRFGERRLSRARGPLASAPASAALGVELRFPGTLRVAAPWDADLSMLDDGRLLLRAHGHTLELSGVVLARTDGSVGAGFAGVAPATVPAGAVLGHAVARLDVRLLDSSVDPAEVPWFCTADTVPGWRTLAADPTPIILPGSALPTGAPEPAERLRRRRERSLADVQEHYYAEPPEIERGWRHHLFDTDARPYLDMVNNVASVGHAHPRIADAVAAQLDLLNTNSRFHYASIVDFSERLAGLLPQPLDTVFLVNSGTEAVDLALRISWAWSGHRDVVTLKEAYHGWSHAADAVSTSIADNPQALESRPDWVHALDAPNGYRGLHRGADSHRYATDAVSRIAELAESGRAPATFIAEAFYGNAGGMPLPDGYLQAVYPAIRASGGLCIADEVQVGYGRLGEHLWGFQQQGVVPDIVTAAKAMGNGHPLGAVVTSRAVADAYRSQGYFFSSAGGSPVSSVVGSTVLDIIRDEALQKNALEVGGHLKARLEALGDRHPLIGAVHGMGLYLGVEFVRDRETREPAPLQTAAICDRMRELGVIVQPTSDRQCVLKIKPPLTLTLEDADRFADTLDHVLSTGW
jgi:4-aminobutyrate aminotransferase-like enzyme/Ser/Thr protein kinase RdoA (MazF antagonist)